VKVLIVTAATGQGHVTAARSLAESLAASGASAKVLDAGEHPAIRRCAAGYDFFLKRPPMWMPLFYAAVEGLRLSEAGGVFLRAWASGVFRREKPDLVVSVHPIFNQGIAGMLEREEAPVPFAIVLTDLCPPFWRGWAEPRAALTVAPTEEAAAALASRGVARGRIAVLGMPVSERFRRRLDVAQRREARRSLLLDPDRFTLLINAGTAGRTTALEVLAALRAEPDVARRVQVLFLAGASEELRRSVDALAEDTPFPLVALGWRQDMDALLDVADALFTKPGGLTLAEALAKGVPLLLDGIGGIFPQERGGAHWAERLDLAWIIRRPVEVAEILRQTPPAQWPERALRCAAALPDGAGVIAGRIQALA
jgi:UDP-N-acetylglucosamine:LPS N-acetylglucosamine transferase